ncbi:hypothetical protein DMN91_004001 [Ooceraea biroi]|uniref:Uncharacterized protein n=1 Tax=Ooceraea biroi TaxID=2015173 RepID=A0A3L8DUE5_OOCBI|nr:hypothetical protein DMN91_004001 [Ooceraea biroi]
MQVADRHPDPYSIRGMHPVATEDSPRADRQDENIESTRDQARDEEKAALTGTAAPRRDGNRVPSSRARSGLIAGANQDHQGSASCASFYLFFSSTFLFTMASTLLSTGAWCFLVRLPMIHLAREPSRIIVVLSGYVFATGALTLPASCILYREHNVTPGRRTLLPPRRKQQQERVENGLSRRDSVGSGMDHSVCRGIMLHVDPGTRPGYRIGRNTFLDLRRASAADG